MSFCYFVLDFFRYSYSFVISVIPVSIPSVAIHHWIAFLRETSLVIFAAMMWRSIVQCHRKRLLSKPCRLPPRSVLDEVKIWMNPTTRRRPRRSLVLSLNWLMACRISSYQINPKSTRVDNNRFKKRWNICGKRRQRQRSYSNDSNQRHWDESDEGKYRSETSIDRQEYFSFVEDITDQEEAVQSQWRFLLEVSSVGNDENELNQRLL